MRYLEISRSVLLFLCVGVCCLRLATAQSCEVLNDPVYGSVTCTGNDENDSCDVQCDEGYELSSSSSTVRHCVCSDPVTCFWNGVEATCELVDDSCPAPSLSGTTYNVVDIAPTGAVVRVTFTPTANSVSGWTVIVVFSSALDSGIAIESYSSRVSAISSNRQVVTFNSQDYNQDVSRRQQYSLTFILTGTDLMSNPTLFTAMVGFYETPIEDGSCFLTINPVDPLDTTTTTTGVSTTTTTTESTTTTTTTTPTTTTTTTTPTTTTVPTTTTTQGSSSIPEGCQEIEYVIDNTGWIENGNWKFSFKYKVPIGDYSDWTIKIVFEAEVTEIEVWDSIADGPHNGGLVWFFTPQSWNSNLNNQQMEAVALAIAAENAAPDAIAILCNNGVVPDDSLISTSESTTTTSASTTTTTTTTTAGATESTTEGTLTPDGPTGILPASSSQTVPNFTPSPEGERDPYDFNEVLHKSILFYEAQRSGELPSTNRIPWRGDSGLKDGCEGDSCVDLVGGWYDAGDFVKFGFPMAYSASVLAWGMVEFQSAYEDAGEWSNALDMLKWATDYFVKAHVSANELYFQVGNPSADHAQWGHPETITIDRPIFKVDESNPGTEVAAETAAALAASSIVFTASDASYAQTLLNHAIELYQFAWDYRGNYQETVPESGVGNYYQSYSGYNDELMWAAMWLYKVTGDESYLNDAIGLKDLVALSEFSWDQKGPGAYVLLSQERSEYTSDLMSGIDGMIAKATTPGGLTFFSNWGSNRYAANAALIALMTAKMEGTDTTKGLEYYNYGRDQIYNMLGNGDNSRSYVVGFGTNPPERPHHRASSCGEWTESDPDSQICDWNDYNADQANPLILYGALVGGPGIDGSYNDARSDFESNEVAVDYNAGFQSAVAALKYFVIQNRST